MQNSPKDFRTEIEVYDYLIDKCGLSIALSVANVLGGTRKSIPANFTKKIKLIEEVGELATKALIEWRGGEAYDFPLWGLGSYARLQQKTREIALRNDLTNNEKARLAHVSRRTIISHKTKKKRVKQLNLFD